MTLLHSKVVEQAFLLKNIAFQLHATQLGVLSYFYAYYLIFVPKVSNYDNTFHSVNKLCDGCIIPHLKPVLGVPAGMRSAVKDSLTNIIGISAETKLKNIAKSLTSSYSLKVENKSNKGNL